jgi:hypothetical protein
VALLAPAQHLHTLDGRIVESPAMIALFTQLTSRSLARTDLYLPHHVCTHLLVITLQRLQTQCLNSMFQLYDCLFCRFGAVPP